MRTPVDMRASPVAKAAAAPATPRPSPRPAQEGFAAVLAEQVQRTDSVRLSAHAGQRLASRNLTLSPQTLTQLADAVDQVAAKGAREALVLMDDLALVVNVPKRTVITALDAGEARNNVFTQIDSAIVVSGTGPAPSTETQPKGPAPTWDGLGAADRLTRRP